MKSKKRIGKPISITVTPEQRAYIDARVAATGGGAARTEVVRAIIDKAMKEPKKDVGCPNSHLRCHVCLTPKQVKALLSALASIVVLRSSESEREYYRKIAEVLENAGQ